MKKAEQWQAELNGETSVESIRAIQLDALLEAAAMCRKQDGLALQAAWRIERLSADMYGGVMQPNARGEQPAPKANTL